MSCGITPPAEAVVQFYSPSRLEVVWFYSPSRLEVMWFYSPSRLEVVQFCVILPLAGGSDAVAAGEGLRYPAGQPSPLVPRDPPKREGGLHKP